MVSPRFSAAIWSLVAASAPLSTVLAIQRPLDYKMERLEQLLWEENFVALTPGSCVRRDKSTLAAEWVRLVRPLGFLDSFSLCSSSHANFPLGLS